jgi:hypothetical protein
MNKNLISEIENRIKENESKTNKWLDELKSLNDKLSAKQPYRNNNNNLIIYANKNNANTLSIRYFGEQVAKMKYKNNSVNISLTSAKIISKKRQGLSWNEFLNLVQKLNIKNIHSEEHKIEMFFYKELTKRANKKLFFKNKIPILLGGKYFFQFPLPIGSSENKLKKVGHVDILIRKGRGRSSTLEVWELKKDSDEHAIFQSLVYAMQIRRLLRDSGWKKFLGYSLKSPKIVAVAFLHGKLSPQQIKKINGEKKKYMKIADDENIELKHIEYVVTESIELLDK